MELRRLAPADHDDVRRILLAAYDVHIQVEKGYADQLVALERRDREAEIWVAVDDGRVVGTVTVCPPGSAYREIALDDEGEFRMLAVDPSLQGRGLGRALSELVVEHFRKAGMRGIALSSTTTMTEAHGLYESLGFVRVPERDWKPAPGVDLLAYRLELSP